LAAARVYELIQAGPVGRFHALLAVGTGEGANRASRLVDLDRESSCLDFERLAVRRRLTGLAVRFGQRQVAEGRHVAEQDERVAILELYRRELVPAGACRFAPAARATSCAARNSASSAAVEAAPSSQ